jgi:hypothetical protein
MTHSNPTLEQVAMLQARSERLQRLREMLEVLIASEARVGSLELGALLEVADSAVAPPPTDAPDMTYEDPRILGTFWAVLDLATGDLCIDGMAQLKTGKTVMAIYPNKPNAAGCDLVQRVEVRCVGNSKPDAPLPESPVSYALKAEAFNTIQLDHNDLRGLFLITKPYMCEDGRSWPGGPAVSLSAAASAIDQLCEDLAKAIAIGQDACRRADSWITREAEQQPVPAEQPTDAPGVVDLEARAFTVYPDNIIRTTSKRRWPTGEQAVPLSVAQAARLRATTPARNVLETYFPEREPGKTMLHDLAFMLGNKIEEERAAKEAAIADAAYYRGIAEHLQADIAATLCEAHVQEMGDNDDCPECRYVAAHQALATTADAKEATEREAAGLRERCEQATKLFRRLDDAGAIGRVMRGLANDVLMFLDTAAPPHAGGEEDE